MRAYLASPMIALALALAVAAPAPTAVAAQKSKKKEMAAEAAKNAKPVVWHDPGEVEKLDFVLGPGGAENMPKPPYTFEEEDTGASNPKIKVTDANGRRWSIKFGHEVNSEVFASRIAWAAGYFVEPSYFVASGKVDGVDRGKLTRAKDFIADDGSFTDGRFELKLDPVAKLKDEQGWGWSDAPLAGTKELNGLKIVMMLTSNWDNKDVRDVGRGSNTAIYVFDTPQGREARWYVTDWGGSMGKWGGVFGREKWDAKGYAGQSSKFLKYSKGKVEFGYSGQHSSDFKNGISAADVAWVAQYLTRITDEQLRAGLKAAGAAPDEIETFVPAIRERLNQLKMVH